MWNKEFYLHFVLHLDPHHELGHKRDVNEDSQHSGVGTSLNGVILVRLKSLREFDIFCLFVCCEVLAQSLLTFLCCRSRFRKHTSTLLSVGI